MPELNDDILPQFIVIDDDYINNTICCMFIKEGIPGAVAKTFTNPEAGLRHIKETYTNNITGKVILLLDINMPTQSGWEVLDYFEGFPDSIKDSFMIYMLSSSIDSNDKQKASEHPLVSGYIQKPLSFQIVQSMVEESRQTVSIR